MRIVQKWSPLISALVVIAYLSAAFIDCEGSLILAFDKPGVGEPVHSMPVAMPVAKTMAKSMHGPAHGRSHGPMSGSETQPTTDAGDHAHGMQHAHSEAREPAPGSTDAAALELRPKCVCGCSETRSTVGGSTSRLGSVIPAVHVARLIEAPSTVVTDRAADLVLEIYTDRDPIPT